MTMAHKLVTDEMVELVRQAFQDWWKAETTADKRTLPEFFRVALDTVANDIVEACVKKMIDGSYSCPMNDWVFVTIGEAVEQIRSLKDKP